MSKVYEALLKLERDLGRVPSGISSEALDVLQKGSADSGFEGQDDDLEARTLGGVVAERPASRATGGSFDLSSAPVEQVKIRPESRLAYHTDPSGAAADRFRLLRMRLRTLWDAGKVKSIFVTSALARDGKSTVVMNLATALAEHGRRKVLVVEGDLCHSSLSPYLGIPQRAGLAECIEKGLHPLPLLRRLDPLGWYLLASGRVHGNTTELLDNQALAGIFETLRPYFDWIIIDTPPVAPLTDTLTLKQFADAGLLVVRADQTPTEAVEDAIGRLGAGSLLGIVLNGSTQVNRLYSEYRKTYGVEKP